MPALCAYECVRRFANRALTDLKHTSVKDRQLKATRSAVVPNTCINDYGIYSKSVYSSEFDVSELVQCNCNSVHSL